MLEVLGLSFEFVKIKIIPSWIVSLEHISGICFTWLDSNFQNLS